MFLNLAHQNTTWHPWRRLRMCLRGRYVSLSSKVAQIGPKLDKSGNFSDQISVHVGTPPLQSDQLWIQSWYPHCVEFSTLQRTGVAYLVYMREMSCGKQAPVGIWYKNLVYFPMAGGNNAMTVSLTGTLVTYSGAGGLFTQSASCRHMPVVQGWQI